MDRQERDRLRALCEAATAGPWAAVWFDAGSAHPWAGDKAQIVGPPRPTVDRGEVFTKADAAFMAVARTALPALLDALDAAEAERRTALYVLGYDNEDTRPLDSLASEALAQKDNELAELRAKLDAAEVSRDEAIKNMWAWRDTVTTIRRATVEAIVRRLRTIEESDPDVEWLTDLIEREFLTEKGGA